MKHFYYTSRIFWSVFLSYFLLLLLILAMLGGLFVGERRKHFAAEQMRRIEETVGDMNLELNQRFFALAEFAQNMSKIPWVHKYYSGYEVFDDYFDAVRKMEISKELTLYFGNMEIVRSACLLFPDRNMTVSTANGWMEMETWLRSASVPEEEWESFGARLEEITAMTCFDSMESWKDGNLMVWVVPLENSCPARAFLLYQVDMAGLKNLIRKWMPDSMESMAIAAQDGRELLCVENEEAVLWGKRSLTEYEMPALGLTYRYAYMENAILLSGEEYMQIFWIMGGTFLLGLLLAYFLAYVTYLPLGRISRRLWGENEKQKNDRFLSDYHLIERSLDSLEQDNQEMSRQIAGYLEMKRGDMLLRLLQGCFDEAGMKEELEFYQIPFRADMAYQVVLLSGGAAGERLVPYRGANLSLSLMKYFSGLEGCHAELVEGLDNHFAGIFAFEGQAEAPAIDVGFAQGLVEIARPYFESHPVVSIGGIQTGYLGISISYHFAMEQKWHMLYNLKMVPCGENAWQNDFIYPQTWEEQLLKGLKLGDLPAVNCIMKEIYGKNMVLWEGGDVPWRRTRELRLMSALLETLLRAVSELSLSDREFLKQIDVLLVGDSFESKWETLLGFCRDISKRAMGMRDSEKTDLGEALLAYVDAHFQDSALCLKELATQFGVTVQTISRLFKARSGDTFYNYLYRKRMEYACELLRCSTDTVVEIAKKTGYENDFSFKRAFVRYTGCRPREYREKILAEGQDFHA